MKKLIMKFSGVIATLALMVTTLNVNAACTFYAYQPELPDGAEKLRKF
ncbi:MAG: cyclic lactone autoinducer peptide [Hungatella sp.]|jgi:cyclic lactone autoinducer peptide|nr:cyclic lactone autoinducer peptide [Hungatella sp.]MDR1771115.1 cyclic lactone autoinducer peptide [Hungatella sp.]MDR2022541.1 cyclic lactone autoinducer peptide [Hungatella sp.]